MTINNYVIIGHQMEMFDHAFQINKKKNNNGLEKCFH